MELTFKQKVAVFSVMLGIFLISVLFKYIINLGDEWEAEEAGEIIQYEEDTLYYEVGDEEFSGESAIIIIDVEGAVTYPGIVKISEGSRVYEAVEEAGGLLDTADTRYVNLAEEVMDGSIIYIPFKGEETQDGTGKQATAKTNINTAGKEELMELPGIGESYASAIIEYRNENGNFKKIEDLMNVTGIGESKYGKLKDLISVY